MPVVRPIGEFGSLGVLLPTAPQGELPGGHGTTTGTTNRLPAATGERTDRAPDLDAAHLAEVCRRAEAAGASALWAVDHLFWPRPMLECLTALSVAALATERCAIGSCVVQVPLRSPASLAKQATALQVLSGGRLVLGVGSGSHPGEYEAAGVDYARRGPLLDEGLDAMRRFWAGDGTGDYRQLPAPSPVPVWVGGSSAAARRRAATKADGWVPLFLGPDELATQIGLLRREVTDAGRDPAAVTPAAVVPVCVGPADRARDEGARWLSSLYGIPPKAFARHLVAGPATQCAGHVRRYLDAGARHVVVMVAADDVVEHFSSLTAELDPAVVADAGAPPLPISQTVAAEPAHQEVMA